MENKSSLKPKFKLPSKNQLQSAIAAFSKKEIVIFVGLCLIFVVSTVILANRVNNSFTTNIPISGGSITEGVLGAPRFVNPVLASNDADRDVVALVYSGLMRKNPDGTLTPDLAEKFVMSEDGLHYTFTLKENLYFHDDSPVLADDVIFTINSVKDPLIKSPRRGNWDGIEVEKVDARTIKFNLREAYGSFLENTTLGIMPKTLWENSPIELNEANSNPIGSGPFKIKKVNKQSSGTIEEYELEAFKNFALGEPFIKKINLKFYQNEEALLEALEEGNINQASSLSPQNANILEEKEYLVFSTTLPRIFGLFFNQNQNQLFIEKSVLEAINIAIDKDRIIRQVLEGYGIAIESPIPENILREENSSEKIKQTREERLTAAREILAKNGWKIGESNFLEKTKTENGKKVISVLEFVISTGNAPELAKTAALIQEDLGEIGMKIEVRTFETGNLNQAVIRPRKYDALLFGEIILSEPDLFAFWHSSQRKDPGLNVAMYTNPKVDKILEETFTTITKDARLKKYQEFQQEIKKDNPAAFIYSPKLVYVVARDIQGLELGNVSTPSDRFANAHLWYIKTDKIWKIFSEN